MDIGRFWMLSKIIQKIEFFNPGKLYGGLIIEQLLSRNYASQTRNRAVARAFKEAGIIEKYGSGIARIQNECKKHEKVEVKFEEFQHGFRITISKKSNIGVKEVYDFIVKNQSIKANQIASNFKNITQRTVERYLKQLKDENKIEFKGAPKTDGYVVKGIDEE